MRVLYCCEDYPISSETYVETELEYFLKNGVEAAVWCRDQDPHRGPSRIPVYDGKLAVAIRLFKPDIIHAHWLDIAQSIIQADNEIPKTVRAHSFDFNTHDIKTLILNRSVRVVWLFPHLQEMFMKSPAGSQYRGSSLERRARKLNSAYTTELHYPEPKEPGTVVRASAGLPTKDLEAFVRIAKLCPDQKFTLILSIPKRLPRAMDNLKGLNAHLGYPVKILEQLPRQEAAAIVRKSQICLRSHDPEGHYYGMPISIAEAMGSGAVIVARDGPGARSYLGPAGQFFKDDRGAAELIRGIAGASESDRAVMMGLSLDRAKRHAAEAVLPEILSEWRSIA